MWDLGAAPRILQLRRMVRRETVRLAVLTAIACAAFLVTRMLAIRAEHRAVEDAAAWYARGENYLEASDPGAAAVAFRRATMKHRDEKRYVLALADALARGGNAEAATRALLQLREVSPEDTAVNLALARLARTQGDTSTALRHYHHSIYAPASNVERAREIRLELIHMLLDAGDATRAVAELITATIDLGEAPDVRLELAQLFERAGNHARAQEQYGRILARDRRRSAAIEGAVRTAFALDDYRTAASYRLPDAASAESRALVDVAREVVARDPLASRLPAAERRRRLQRNISYVERRWRDCAPTAAPDYPPSLRDLRAGARRAAIGRDLEALETALASLDRVRQQLEPRCPDRTAVDRALDVVARLHRVTTP